MNNILQGVSQISGEPFQYECKHKERNLSYLSIFLVAGRSKSVCGSQEVAFLILPRVKSCCFGMTWLKLYPEHLVVLCRLCPESVAEALPSKPPMSARIKHYLNTTLAAIYTHVSEKKLH